MSGPTTALLHGLKAVYAPVPVHFDRQWTGEELEKYFNPGPKGESGSSLGSPFSFGHESRFRGSTWYYRVRSFPSDINSGYGFVESGIR